MKLPLGAQTLVALPAPPVDGYIWTRLGHEDLYSSKRLSSENLRVRRIMTRKTRKGKKTDSVAGNSTSSKTAENSTSNETAENSTSIGTAEKKVFFALEPADRMEVTVKTYGVHLLEFVYMDVDKGSDSILKRYTLEIECMP